uniref:(northern house mosquito) hypothetical protein n=2 Tax=Culex pipiens TaxID=7175 RepID=A0A8D8E5F5_CULPI
MKKRELNEWRGVYNFMILSRKFLHITQQQLLQTQGLMHVVRRSKVVNPKQMVDFLPRCVHGIVKQAQIVLQSAGAGFCHGKSLICVLFAELIVVKVLQPLEVVPEPVRSVRYSQRDCLQVILDAGNFTLVRLLIGDSFDEHPVFESLATTAVPRIVADIQRF